MTALVFDHLSTESLRLAQKAALDYLPTAGESSAQIGVFTSGPGFGSCSATRGIGPSCGAPSRKSRRPEHPVAKTSCNARRSCWPAAVESRTRPRPPGPRRRGRAALPPVLPRRRSVNMRAKRALQTELNMIRSFDSLIAITRATRRRGRCSRSWNPWRTRPGARRSCSSPKDCRLSGAVRETRHAHRRGEPAHVTTYAIDAKGLSTRSSNEAVSKEVDAFVTERPVSCPPVRCDQRAAHDVIQRVEDTSSSTRAPAWRGWPRIPAVRSSKTNDLSNAFRRIDEDTRFHYLLTYRREYEFRREVRSIGVKVRRPAFASWRKGYRAIRWGFTRTPPAMKRRRWRSSVGRPCHERFPSMPRRSASPIPPAPA